MKIGMIGLGKMGANMTRRLTQKGHEVVAFSRGGERGQKTAASVGAKWAPDPASLASRLEAPRVVWLMIPAGDPVDQTIAALRPRLAPGDVVVDGGNSRYVDSVRRAKDLAASGIEFLDAGTSGGVWGLSVGYCLMVGGTEAAFSRVEPALRDLAPENGYARVGPSGAGHFTKMVHNAIEYSMLQGLGEGFELLRSSEFGLDLRQLAELWNHGGVIRSWLLELLADALEKDPDLSKVRGWVDDSGEGRWTLHEAIDRAVPAPALAEALFARFRSRQAESYSAKAIAALRNEFGGHAVKSE
jgi:6-phosphogluconate dehydrogenase